MATIRPKDTSPELLLRSFLHRQGFRFRLHVRDLAGRPDIVLRGRRVVLFVHGCFWHQHEGCALAAFPASNVAFWKKKLKGNLRRDASQIAKLREEGWRVGVVWECAARKGVADVRTLRALKTWLLKPGGYKEFPATPLRKKAGTYRRAKMR